MNFELKKQQSSLLSLVDISLMTNLETNFWDWADTDQKPQPSFGLGLKMPLDFENRLITEILPI